MALRLGLTCISEILKEEDKKAAFRTMTRKQFLKKFQENEVDTLGHLCHIILHNLEVTEKIVRFCHHLSSNRGYVAHYRLSSSLFPLLTDQTLNLSMDSFSDIQIATPELKAPASRAISKKIREVGDAIRYEGITVGLHPDQFNVLASKNKNVVNKTINELNYQCDFLDSMELPEDYTVPVNLHLNSNPKNESIESYADRLVDNFLNLSESVQRRLTLENEDKGFWNASNLYKLHQYIKQKYCINIPLCYDNLHDTCNPSDLKNPIEIFAETWGTFTPIFHWSEGLQDKPRSHADYFTTSPPEQYNVIWECEVKAKDKAIRLLL